MSSAVKTNGADGLTLAQKIVIGLIAGAIVGAVGALAQHYAGAHFIKKNGRKKIK